MEVVGYDSWRTRSHHTETILASSLTAIGEALSSSVAAETPWCGPTSGNGMGTAGARSFLPESVPRHP